MPKLSMGTGSRVLMCHGRPPLCRGPHDSANDNLELKLRPVPWGSLLLLVCTPTTPVSVLLAVGVVLGIPNGFNNLGLQAALYEHAPAQHMGAASGQFQTFRYVGAILSTSLLGLAFGTTVTSHGLHLLAYALAGIISLHLVAGITTR